MTTTFQFKLITSHDQQKLLWKHANLMNGIHNLMVAERSEKYAKGIKVTWGQQQASLVQMKHDNPELKEIYSQVLQQIPLRIKNTYKASFKKIKKGEKPGFPRFRSCKKFYGITYPQLGFMIEGNLFSKTVYGDMRFIKYREIRGNIKQISISNKNNAFYLNVMTDYKKLSNQTKIKEIGIDLGLKNIVVGSDGLVIENKNHAKYFDKEIAKLQSKQSKCKKGSRQYKYYRKIMNRLYELKVRKTNDFQHKISKRLANTYDTIYAEDLSVKRMMQSNKTGLNKSIGNAKFSQLLTFLGYKTNHLVLVNPKNTSKTCNFCGYVHQNMKLKDRTITCPCGATYDRDENASKNILCLGQAIVAKRCTESETIQEALSFT